jgi:serine/threonine protein kinase
MNIPLSIISCKDNIIKYSFNNITFFNEDCVFKQFIFNKYKWVNELINVNTLNHPNIIKFNKCEILDDYIVDIQNKEIDLTHKEKIVRITMNRYNTTIDTLKKSTDSEIFYIINSLLSAIIYCNSKNILHRDIKEKNIFVNFKYIKYTTNKVIKKKRIITDVVLADFNISKYKYQIQSINKHKIMTVSHRPPEISNAILSNKHFNYDERVDVWSFCIVLSFLITGKSFYSFLNDGYLSIDNTIICSAYKLNTIMTHFIKIHASKKLKHIDLYKKIIYMGIKPYTYRSTFMDINNLIKLYACDKKLAYKLNVNVDLYPKSPEQILTNKIVNESELIYKLHHILGYNNAIIVTYYKIYNKMILQNFVFNDVNMIALYIIIVLLVLDKIISIDSIIHILINNFNNKNISKISIETEIANIVKNNNYKLL